MHRQKQSHTSHTVRMVLAALMLLSGCSRTEHRINADREAYCTIAERNNDPRWAAANVGIDLNPHSRYFDPYNPDCSPMPVDDPASHQYMMCVDGKKGWKHWLKPASSISVFQLGSDGFAV